MKARRRARKSPLLLPTGSGRPFDLRERTFEFAVRMLQVVAALPVSAESHVVRQQLVRAGTSIGANVEEADGALTPADKRKSFVVARKEAREVRFWLRIIERRWPKAVDLKADLQEATELILILSSIVAKLG